MILHHHHNHTADEEDGSISTASGTDAASHTPFLPQNAADDDDDEEKGGETTTRPSPPPPPPPEPTPRVRWRDLPHKDQLLILSLCRLSEPLSSVTVLPYIYFLVRAALTTTTPTTSSSSPDEARIATYSGLLVAIFPLAQALVSVPWGRASDGVGRRPLILLGLLLAVLANTGFAFSRRLPGLFLWRALAGLANGNVSLMRAATAEAVGGDPRYRARAFLLLPLVFNAGTALSLALGGWLARSGTAGEEGVAVAWAGREFPFAPPALLNAGVLAGALAVAALGLRETLPGREGRRDAGLRAGEAVARALRRLLRQQRPTRRRRHLAMAEDEDEDAGLLPGVVEAKSERDDEEAFRGSRSGSGSGNSSSSSSSSTTKIWTSRRVFASLVSFGLLPLHNAAFMHVLPVYLSAAPADDYHNNSHSNNHDSHDNPPATTPSWFAFTGGLGLRASTIGIFLSLSGLGGILLQLFLYPRLQAWLGTRGVFRLALFVFPVAYAAAPYLTLVSADHHHHGPGQEENVGRWGFLGAVVGAQVLARTLGIPSTVILLTEAAPSRRVLGAVHGAGNALACAARAVGPAVGGWVLARGVEAGVVGLVWWAYLVAVALGALAWSYCVDDGR
ncbi:major facilitator superfamily domain-containing protein [Xylariomycetidae sp. FL0641]|nr:major facilitator superfamily domain-containing protein [Xylariomycetidae sp. FL0641]